MSTESTKVATKLKKDVTITCYGDSDYSDERAFAQAIIGDEMDLYSKRTTTRTRRFLAVTDPEGKAHRVEITNDVYDTLAEARLLGAELGDVRVTNEEKSESKYRHSPTNAISALIEQFCESYPDRLANKYERATYNAKWWSFDYENAEYDVRVNAAYDSVARRRVLRHQSERTSDERYETPADTPDSELPWSFQATVRIEAPSRRLMDQLSSELTTKLYNDLSKVPTLRKARITDCMEVTEQQGDCFDL